MNKTNIEILDDCVNGDVENLKHLIGDSHTQFTEFCKIYRDLFGEMKEFVSYDRNVEKGLFSVIVNDSYMTPEIMETIKTSSNVKYSHTDRGVLVNISVI